MADRVGTNDLHINLTEAGESGSFHVTHQRRVPGETEAPHTVSFAKDGDSFALQLSGDQFQEVREFFNSGINGA